MNHRSNAIGSLLGEIQHAERAKGAIRKVFACDPRGLAAAQGALTISVTGSALAVTTQELAGDYTLTEIDISYGGSFPPPLDEGDFPTLAGYLSATTEALVFEHAGQDTTNVTIYRHIVAGTYQITGNAVAVSRADGASVTVQISMPNNDTVVFSGTARDSNNASYIYTYRYRRDETYYTQEALDDAIASATDGLFTQEELNTAVDEAVSNVVPKVVPIIFTE